MKHKQNMERKAQISKNNFYGKEATARYNNKYNQNKKYVNYRNFDNNTVVSQSNISTSGKKTSNSSSADIEYLKNLAVLPPIKNKKVISQLDRVRPTVNTPYRKLSTLSLNLNSRFMSTTPKGVSAKNKAFLQFIDSAFDTIKVSQRIEPKAKKRIFEQASSLLYSNFNKNETSKLSEALNATNTYDNGQKASKNTYKNGNKSGRAMLDAIDKLIIAQNSKSLLTIDKDIKHDNVPLLRRTAGDSVADRKAVGRAVYEMAKEKYMRENSDKGGEKELSSYFSKHYSKNKSKYYKEYYKGGNLRGNVPNKLSDSVNKDSKPNKRILVDSVSLKAKNRGDNKKNSNTTKLSEVSNTSYSTVNSKKQATHKEIVGGGSFLSEAIVTLKSILRKSANNVKNEHRSVQNSRKQKLMVSENTSENIRNTVLDKTVDSSSKKTYDNINNKNKK
jgi:hypothetical protein